MQVAKFFSFIRRESLCLLPEGKYRRHSSRCLVLNDILNVTWLIIYGVLEEIDRALQPNILPAHSENFSYISFS